MAPLNLRPQPFENGQQTSSLERDRLRVRAKELQRQKLVLDNELQSPGISPAEREYIQQRVQTLSNDEDVLGANLARVERQLDAQRQVELERQTSVQAAPSRASRPGTIASEQRPEVVRAVQASLTQNLVATEKQFTQANTADQRNIASLKKKIKPPRKLVYFPLIYLCVIVDVIAILQFTGVLLPLVEGVNIGFSIFMFVVSIFLGRSMKRTRVSGERVSQVIAGVEQRVALYRQRIATVIRYARRTNIGRRVLANRRVRGAVSFTAKYAKTARSPILRSIGSGIVEWIPVVNAFPWYTINTVLTYREHLKEYRASLATVSDYQPAAAEEAETVQEFQQAQVAEAEAVLQVAA